VSEPPKSPATPGADAPAALVPDDAIAGHRSGEPGGAGPLASTPALSAEPAPSTASPSSASESVGAVSGSEPAVAPVWTPPAPPQSTSAASGASGAAAVAAERPELAVGAAFAGGLALALILKRLAR